MRLTRHNGRTGKNGVFNPKHNDRRFDIGNSEHIDEDRARQNLYWDCHNGFSSAGKKFDNGEESYSFEQIERAFYFNNYSDFVWGQNERNEKARHSERNRTVDDLLKSKKTCPEESIYQIGTIEESVSWETLTKIAVEFFADLDQKYGSHVHILDWALHVDEGTPHIHERHVFDCKNRYGELCPQQEKALEELGIPLPDPDKKPGKNNNRKQTFDAECRKMLFAICEKYQLSLQEETSYGGRGYLEKQDYIIAKQKDVLAETSTALEAVTMKLADMETLVDEVAEQAYDKACSVVADTVREETKRADIEEVVRYREWLADPERKVEPKIREYALRHFNKLIERLSAGVKNLAEKIAKKLQEPAKRAENMEQVKVTAKRSLLAQLEEHKKKVEEYKAQYYGTHVQQTRKGGQDIE